MMMRSRAITRKLYSSCLLATSKSFLTSSVPPLVAKTKTSHGSIFPQFEGNVYT